YRRMARLFQFPEARRWFEDLDGQMTTFSMSISGEARPDENINFIYVANLQGIDALELSFDHDGSGPLPGIQYPEGVWDLRPQRARIVTIDQGVLADCARLFDEPGTPAEHARLLRPVTSQDLAALTV